MVSFAGNRGRAEGTTVDRRFRMPGSGRPAQGFRGDLAGGPAHRDEAAMNGAQLSLFESRMELRASPAGEGSSGFGDADSGSGAPVFRNLR